MRADRMVVVHKYDLSTEVSRLQFAKEIILQRSSAEIDMDVNTLPLVESKALHAKNTANIVDFWSA